MASVDNTQRFSDRVAVYVAHRPSYPAAAIDFLVEQYHLDAKAATIVDLGSGTGILSRLLLERLDKATVIGVEPNEPMRKAGEENLGHFISSGRFSSISGTAEETGLDDQCADLIVAGQAFHWFDVQKSRLECQRLLGEQDEKGVALIWNDRRGGDGRTSTTPFMQEYESLLQKHSKIYAQVNHHTTVTEDVLRQFFGPAGFEMKQYNNPYIMTHEQLVGRMLSSSYSPQVGEPGHEAMLVGLRQAFAAHETAGTIQFEYDTKIMFGKISR
ncbi:hypothetical protein FH972_022986 [Carpinus fangiana]|uniref:Methyltransferase type 11 domain-containing protein n=1 Tax=Carpinus fangiana TaxID=176857 RepID=A0A5N6KUC8_9ROSI|nr:hypothetical protein FH972_022986 [Carpinus fangiana]